MAAGYLFTDIEDSTARWERRGAAMRDASARHDAIIDAAVERHGGVVCDRAGDGVFALFAGGDALACALDIQLALAREDWSEVEGLPVRIGVHAAPVDQSGGPERVAANRAARIMQRGTGGEILASGEALEAFGAPPGAEVVEIGLCRLRGVTEPMRLFGLVHPALTQARAAHVRARPRAVSGLPAATAIMGRERELHELEQVLEAGQARLVSVVGPAGNGKTALVTELARRLSAARPVCYIPLEQEEAAGGEGLGPAIARALDLPLRGEEEPLAQLIAHLRERDLLLVLDSAEISPEAGPAAQRIGAACPGVVVLAASRAPLGAQGEQLYRLGGLACTGPSPDEVAASPAYAMFADQVLRFDPDFSLDEDGAGVFHAVCGRVGGSPLALKLIARWRRLLTLKEILGRLDGGLDFLSDAGQDAHAREGALGRVLDSSWRLLGKDQQRCLARLSTFAGGFDALAGEAVASAAAASFIELEDRGLIQRIAPRRFALHALIQDHAARKLAEDAEDEHEARERHARYFLSALARRGAQIEILDWAERELANLGAAWRFALGAGCKEMVQAAAEPLFYLLAIRSRFHEARDFFAEVAVDDDMGAYFEALRANCLVHMGRLEDARAAAQAALSRGASELALAHAHQALANLGHVHGDFDAAFRHYQRALALRERAGDAMGRCYASVSIGWVELARGETKRARERARETYSLCRAISNAAGLMHAYMLAGDVARAEGRNEDARANYLAALAEEELVGDRAQRASALVKLGAAHLRLGEVEAAANRQSEAMVLACELGEERIGALARIERALALRALGETQSARRCLVGALRASLRLGARPLLARAVLELGRLEQETGNLERARRLAAVLSAIPVEARDREQEALLAEFGMSGADAAAGSADAALEDVILEAEYAAERL